MDGDPPTTPSDSPKTTRENLVQAKLWKEARSLLDDQLSENQKRHYHFMQDTFEDVEAEKSKDDFVAESKSLVKEMEAFQQNARNKTRIRSVKVKNKAFDINFNTILHRLQVVINVGDAVVAYTPEIVSAVWGTLKLVFDFFQKPMALQETLADAVDRMVELIFVCRLYCGLYFSDEREASKRVIEKIPSLYTTVLHFCYEAQYFAKSNRIKKLAKTMFLDWNQEFQNLSTSAQTGLDELHRAADIPFKQAAMEFFDKLEKNADQKLHDFGDAIGIKLDSGLKDMQLGLERIEKEHRARQKFQETKQEHKELCNWLLGHTSLNPGGPSEQLNTNLDKKLPGTCKWILNNDEYVKWSDEHVHNDDSGVLWISGDPGFGKSILTASIIHRLSPERKRKSLETLDEPERVDKQEKQLLFFFCKAGDNRTQKSEKIIIHLLYQLFADSEPSSWDDLDQISAAEECNRIMQDIRPRRKNRDQAVSVGLYVLQTAFKKVAAAVKNPVFIIIDAVDECSDPKNLVFTLAGLVRKDGDVRLLFSSRPESNIVESFDAINAPKARVDVTKEVNQRDIGAYVKWWMKKLPKLSKRLQKEAQEKICKKAGGQFRYASVAIESLVCAKGVADAQKALSSLPDSMSEFYRKNAQGLDEVHQKWLLIAFRWIICGHGSVDASIIADELETMFANEQDDQDQGPHESFDDRGSDSEDEKDDDEESIVSEQDSDDEDTQRFEKGALTSGLAAVAQRGLPVHHGFLFDSDLRWSVRQLLAVAHDFLKIDSNRFVGLQHASVGDWITEDKRSLEYLNKTLCENCHRQIHSGSGSVFRSHEAAPEYGHLLMAAYIMKTLNNNKFQHRHILVHQYPSTDRAVMEDRSDSDSEMIPDNPFLQRTQLQKFDVRYEITHWPYHIRKCERTWPEKKFNTMAEQYKDIMQSMRDNLVKFMDPNSQTFKAWQRLTWPDRSQFLSPMHVAACLGLQNLMKTLLSQGSDLFDTSSNRETPLHLACLGQGEFQGVVFLLRKMKEEIKQRLGEEAGDAHINEEMTKWINMKEMTSERTPLLCAVKSGADKTCVSNLLNYGADPSIGDSRGYTCLHISASLRKEELCRLFVCSEKNKDGELVKAKDKDGETPLHWLLKSKLATPNLAKCLIESDPTGEIVNMKDEAFQTPLYEACKSGNVSCARELLDRGASIHDEDMSGWSPLNAAISTEDVELVELLLEGRETSLIEKRFSSDPIFQAARNGCSHILRSLLSIRKKLDPDMGFLLLPDSNNTMLLHWCIQNGDYDIVKILLEQREVRCAEAMTLKDVAGLTPIGHAVSCWMHAFNQSQQTLFEDILLELSACKPDSAELIDFLNAAIELGNSSVCEKFSHLGILGTKDEHGWTSMQLAHEEQKHEVLKILQQQNSQVKIQKDRDSQGVGIPPAAFYESDEEGLLSVSEDGLVIQGRTWGRLASVRADHPVPAARTHYYYEVTVLRCGSTDPVNIIGVGFCSKYFELRKMPGWESRFASFGYHGDDGCFYQSDEGIFLGETFGEDDVIGVALDFERDEVFFTRNGAVLGKKSKQNLAKGRLYPVVGMNPVVQVRANFGPDGFKFNWMREPVS